MFTCRDGKGSELSGQASRMLHKPRHTGNRSTNQSLCGSEIIVISIIQLYSFRVVQSITFCRQLSKLILRNGINDFLSTYQPASRALSKNIFLYHTLLNDGKRITWEYILIFVRL